MLLLRVLSRLIGVLWVIALALLGLGIALYCVDALVGLGSARPDRLLHLPTVRQHVGRFLDQVAASGGTAGLALLCGLGAVAIGVLLLLGTLRSGRERYAVLDDDAQAGRLAARRRTLRELARALAEQAGEATAIRRLRVRLARRGTRGRLTVQAVRSRTSPPDEVEEALRQSLSPLTEPFHLRSRVRVQLGESGERVR